MKELNFDTGMVSYKLNGTVEIAFNPTDAAFVERLFSTFNILDKLQDDYNAEKGSTTDHQNFFDTARKYDAEMRKLIDDVLGAPVCDALFGQMNVYAFADGLPVWCNLMLALLAEVPGAFTREQEAVNPRLQKYLAKYK